MISIDDISVYFSGLKRLKQDGQGFKACCPYHTEKTPSFSINLPKKMCKCFGCGEFRPLFDFLLEMGAPFEVAIEFIFTDYTKVGKDNKELVEYRLGRKIPKSMLDRGFEIETLKHFRVGYDEVEGHTTIPLIYNTKIYGIKYRMFPKKFWYSDEFLKDTFVYNYDPNREVAVLVEGETDTWSTWQKGTENVEALLGCELTETQAKLLAKHKVLLLALDNDMAGFRGAFRVHDMLRDEVEIRIVPYPASDPAECSKEDWLNALEDTRTFIEFEINFMKRYPEEYELIVSKLQNR